VRLGTLHYELAERYSDLAKRASELPPGQGQERPTSRLPRTSDRQDALAGNVADLATPQPRAASRDMSVKK
jgi:hypothetical protein